jgi:hypothetical protein
MSCKYKGEDRSWVVIGYRSILEFYSQELHYFQDSNQKHRQCACGCRQPAFDRKKWASPGRRQRVARQKATDTQIEQDKKGYLVYGQTRQTNKSSNSGSCYGVETQGLSQRHIVEVTGVSLGTVHAILNRAHGWDEIAEGEVFKRHSQEQNKALEQANRTLAKKSLEMAEGKMDKASYSQLVFGAAMTDKARLLAGEPT